MVKSRSPALRTSMDHVNLRAVLHKFSPTHPFLLKSLAGTTVDPISITVMRIISTLNMKGERWAHSCGWVTTLFKAIWSQYGYQVLLPPPSDMILWSMIWINLGWTVIRFQYLLLGNQFGESKVYGKKKPENIMVETDGDYTVYGAFTHLSSKVIFRKMNVCVFWQPATMPRLSYEVEYSFAAIKTSVSYGPTDSTTWKRQPRTELHSDLQYYTIFVQCSTEGTKSNIF